MVSISTYRGTARWRYRTCKVSIDDMMVNYFENLKLLVLDTGANYFDYFFSEYNR